MPWIKAAGAKHTNIVLAQLLPIIFTYFDDTQGLIQNLFNQLLTNFPKSSILDVLLGSQYVYDTRCKDEQELQKGPDIETFVFWE